MFVFVVVVYLKPVMYSCVLVVGPGGTQSRFHSYFYEVKVVITLCPRSDSLGRVDCVETHLLCVGVFLALHISDLKKMLRLVYFDLFRLKSCELVLKHKVSYLYQ